MKKLLLIIAILITSHLAIGQDIDITPMDSTDWFSLVEDSKGVQDTVQGYCLIPTEISNLLRFRPQTPDLGLFRWERCRKVVHYKFMGEVRIPYRESRAELYPDWRGIGLDSLVFFFEWPKKKR